MDGSMRGLLDAASDLPSATDLSERVDPIHLMTEVPIHRHHITRDGAVVARRALGLHALAAVELPNLGFFVAVVLNVLQERVLTVVMGRAAP